MIEIIVAIVTGTTTGVTAAVLTAKHMSKQASVVQDTDFNTYVEDRDFDTAALKWATSVGRPGFAPYVAKKLRTVAHIHAARERRQASDRRYP